MNSSFIPGTAASMCTTNLALMSMRINAAKVCGSIVKVELSEFQKILSSMPEPVLVWAKGGIFSTHYRYLTNYKGLTIFCKSPAGIEVPENADIIRAKKISIPDI